MSATPLPKVNWLGRRTEQQFDVRGELTQILHADGLTNRYRYDEAGRRIADAQVAPAARPILRAFDAVGNLVGVTYPDDTPDPSDNPRRGFDPDA